MEEPQLLNIDETQPIQYCIPHWLRDEQIKLSTNRIKKRIEERMEKRDDDVAIVCFGPSLNDTWEEIKKFKYIFSCSGAHKFLIDRGIIPTWHVEVDPRPHKIQLIGQPHKDVEYLIASSCHPKVFDHLSEYNVKLWHIFSNEIEAFRVLPTGEWSLTGGSSVGLRALVMARFFGFTNLHIFGMDGCEGKSGKHADVHPMQPTGHSIVEYGGVSYKTTPSLLECAKQTFRELNLLKDVRPKFYGEGLVQSMFKNYKPKYSEGEIYIAVNKPELISEEYKKLNCKLHEDDLTYGVYGATHTQAIMKLAAGLKTTRILDYGCGKGYLAKSIPYPIWEYDPAIPGKDEIPRDADLVVCTDVLEHIEPDRLLFVLNNLKQCTKKMGFFTIHTGASTKFLSDGRNAHLIQENQEWWTKKLSKFFTIPTGAIIVKEPVLYVLVFPKELEGKL
jgi:uncharacterized Rossmann fold enzyme/2-polyprenyl-3-methyl-5-hydroxy-6-metoxy-1,4-benzoquinol methylase